MRILLATDGSPQAQAAEVLAEWLAYKLEAKLVALFVKDIRLLQGLEFLDLGALTIPWPTRKAELDQALTAKGEAILNRIRQSAEAAGIPAEGILDTGNPYEVILRHARTADLLVLGRSGETHGGSFTGLGSTVDRLLRTCPTPILIAPLDYVEPKGAVLGYDASESATRAMRVLASLARPLRLRVRVVSVNEDPVQAGAWALEAQTYLQDQGLLAEALAFSGDPGEHLLGLAGPEDILAVGTPVRRLILGSTAEYVARHAVGPVLTVR